MLDRFLDRKTPTNEKAILTYQRNTSNRIAAANKEIQIVDPAMHLISGVHHLVGSFDFNHQKISRE